MIIKALGKVVFRGAAPETPTYPSQAELKKIAIEKRRAEKKPKK